MKRGSEEKLRNIYIICEMWQSERRKGRTSKKDMKRGREEKMRERDVKRGSEEEERKKNEKRQ